MRGARSHQIVPVALGFALAVVQASDAAAFAVEVLAGFLSRAVGSGFLLLAVAIALEHGTRGRNAASLWTGEVAATAQRVRAASARVRISAIVAA